MNHRESTRNALHSYIQKQMNDRERKTKRKYNNPEKTETQPLVIKWCKDQGFDMSVIEASTYNGRTKSFGDSKAEAGFSDLVGNTSTGLACYIELKARGRRHNLSDSQRKFLIRKINSLCFAVVVDSDERLEKYWKQFCALKTPEQRKAFLHDCLPGSYNTEKRRKAQAKEDEFGF